MTLIASMLLTASLSVSQPREQVDACFVLDTTGSMSAMIQTAKEKIWFIANEIVRASQTPAVRFCLLAYRDEGDAYITRHFDLTHNIDSIQEELMALTADGGGDTPEAVNQALFEAVENTSWSFDPNTLRLIFIIGDAPPHKERDEPQYPEIVRLADSRGILINPIFVGGHHGAREDFAAMAAAGRGQFLAVDPGASKPVHTMVDEDLAVLGQRLARTALPYGPPAQRSEYFARVERSEELSDATASDRVAFQVASSSTVGDDDLVDLVSRGAVDITAIEREWLPETLRSMNKEELDRHLAGVRNERAQLKALIQRLVGERAQILQSRRDVSSFESRVSQVVKEQLDALAVDS